MEFEQHLAQTGPEGGCEACVEWSPKRRKGMVRIDEDGNYTTYEGDELREIATKAAYDACKGTKEGIRG